MSRSTLRLSLLVGSLALFGGCSDSDHDNDFVATPAGQGNMRVFVTDAPPDLDGLRAVIVNIQRIDAVGVLQSGSSTGSTPVTLFDAAPGDGPAFDLLQLRGGQRAQVASASVPSGTYDALRVTISRAQVDFQPPGNVPTRTFSTENGLLTFSGGSVPQVLELELPGNGITVNPGETEDVLIDLDLATSLNAVGDPSNPEAIVVTPAGTVRSLDAPGAVSGVVRAGQNTAQTGDDVPLENVRVALLNEDQTVAASTLTDRSGVFVMEGVPAGTFAIVTQAEGEQPIVSSVQVTDQRVTADQTIPTATTTNP